MSETKKGKWLAYELHDRLMPWIHGASMQLAKLNVSQESQKQLDIARQCLQMAAEEGRALIGFIESHLSENSTESLEMNVRKFVAFSQPLAQQAQQEIQFAEGFKLGSDRSPSQSWAILRTIQQAVQNAIQHAGPCLIELHSHEEPSSLTIEVRDNGRGFDPNQASAGHFGLESMRNRAEAIGAELQIRSEKGKGTIVTLKVPRR